MCGVVLPVCQLPVHDSFGCLQASHHSMYSWVAQWNANREMYDGEIAALGALTGTNITAPAVSNTSTNSSGAYVSGPASSSQPVEARDATMAEHEVDEDDAEDDDTDWDKMTPGHSRINDTDQYAMARYIASFSSTTWDSLSSTRRWEPFAAQVSFVFSIVSDARD